MDLMIKEGERIHFISDQDSQTERFKAELMIKKELYRNGRKQGFLAEDADNGRLFFLKVLYTGDLEDTFVQKESKVQIYSPFIIRIYGGMLYKEKNCFLTLIEYRKEQDLSDMIRFGGLAHYAADEKIRIKHKIVLKILYGIYHYMAMYKEDPIVHRDLKPENIMASPDGEIVKIIDFDWVHLHKSNVTVMSGREQKGTLGYAEPRAWNSSRVSIGMDIYSAGLLFYFIYMERHHFSGQDEISHYLMAGEYAYSLKDTPGMDIELREILEKMIAREGDRYKSIEDVINDFTAYLKKKQLYPVIPELLEEKPVKSVKICYKMGPALYTPVIRENHFYHVKYGSKQLRSRNGILTSHILSFYYTNHQVRCVILDDRCSKCTSLNEKKEILNAGDRFLYADIQIEIMKIEEAL